MNDWQTKVDLALPGQLKSVDWQNAKCYISWNVPAVPNSNKKRAFPQKLIIFRWILVSILAYFPDEWCNHCKCPWCLRFKIFNIEDIEYSESIQGKGVEYWRPVSRWWWWNIAAHHWIYYSQKKSKFLHLLLEWKLLGIEELILHTSPVFTTLLPILQNRINDLGVIVSLEEHVGQLQLLGQLGQHIWWPTRSWAETRRSQTRLKLLSTLALQQANQRVPETLELFFFKINLWLLVETRNLQICKYANFAMPKTATNLHGKKPLNICKYVKFGLPKTVKLLDSKPAWKQPLLEALLPPCQARKHSEEKKI